MLDLGKTTTDDRVEFRRGDKAGWWIGDRRATAAEVAAARPRCPNGGRHWFTVYRHVGLRKPYCDRCGMPNPYITPEELREYEGCYPDGRRSLYCADSPCMMDALCVLPHGHAGQHAGNRA